MLLGFSVQNSLNKGPFSSRLSLMMGGFSRNWQKIVKKLSKMSSFPPEFIIKVVMVATVGN